MKKFNIILALVLVFAFVGCTTEPDDGPELTVVYVITRADWEASKINPTNTITASERFMLHYIGKSPNENLTGFGMTIKSGTTLISTEESPFANIVSRTPLFSFVTGIYTLAAGTYTIDVYVVDAKNKKSNTKSVSITVTER